MAITGKILDHVLKKFMKAEVAQNARVQVELPNGEIYDMTQVYCWRIVSWVIVRLIDWFSDAKNLSIISVKSSVNYKLY